jgi:serine/threonine protein kinase
MDFAYNFNSSSSYSFKRRLGGGGSADVLLYSRHTEGLPDQEVVLKVFKNKNPEAMAELINEGVRLTEFKHPHILSTFGYEKINSNTFALILDYIQGKNLKEILNHLRKESRPAIAAYVIGAVADALRAAHSQKIIHGDISSRNILISELGQVKLSDFGQARSLGVSTMLTRNKGSIDYLAPERWEGAPTSREADVFALGILVYEILSGENPLTQKKSKKFFKCCPWKIYSQWQRFFDLTLQFEAYKRGTIDEVFDSVPQVFGGQEEVMKYLSPENSTTSIEHQHSTKTFVFKKSFLKDSLRYVIALPLFRPMIAAIFLVTPGATGVDHSTLQELLRPSALTITSEPWGEVFIDGESLGFTPIINYSLKAGYHHFLWVNRDGLKVNRSIMNYGRGVFAYQITKNKGRPIKIAPLMRED